MRILHIIPRLSIGGAERLVIDICEELSRRDGISAALLVFDSINEFGQEFNFPVYISDSYVKLSVFKSNKYYLDSLDKIITEFNPDIIHSHLFEAEILTHAKQYDNVQYFSHFHDNIPQLNKIRFNTFFSKTKLIYFFERNWLLGRYETTVTNIIAVSKHTLEYINKNIPLNKFKSVKFLPNAINLSKFSRFKNSNNSKINGKLRLISVGSLVRKKNQYFQLKVVKELVNRGVDIELLIFGEGNDRDFLSQKIAMLGITNQVKLMGNVTNISSYLSISDVFIHTALYEPFGLVFLEAMATKTPIVTLNGKGNVDITIDGYNSLLVDDFENVHFFCDSIELIVNDFELREKIVNNAFEFVKRYDIKHYVNSLLNIYESR